MATNSSSRSTASSLGRACWLLALAFLLMGWLGREIPGAQTQAAGRLRKIPARFTIADFDGDHRPDLATIVAERPDERGSNYSIYLRFSVGPESVIGISAPVGGLQIFSQDVNGDDKLDLVVRTSVDANLVAILLNDGHGNFRKAELAAFPDLQQEPVVYIAVRGARLIERISLLPPRNNAGQSGSAEIGERLQWVAEPVQGQADPGFTSFLFKSSFGRSPPSGRLRPEIIP